MFFNVFILYRIFENDGDKGQNHGWNHRFVHFGIDIKSKICSTNLRQIWIFTTYKTLVFVYWFTANNRRQFEMNRIESNNCDYTVLLFVFGLNVWYFDTFLFLFLCWNDIFDISADKISHFTSQLTQMEFNQRIRMSTNVKKRHSYIWWFKTTQSHDYFIHRMLSSCISISLTTEMSWISGVWWYSWVNT